MRNNLKSNRQRNAPNGARYGQARSLARSGIGNGPLK